MGQNINIENIQNGAIVNIYNNSEDKEREHKAVTIAGVDKYSSPLKADLDFSPWGEKYYRIAFHLRNLLLGQVIQQEHLTFSDEKKAKNVMEDIFNFLKDIKKEAESKNRHSSLIVPDIRKGLKNYTKLSEIKEPESKDLSYRYTNGGNDTENNNGGRPYGLLLHPVEDHFPDHNEILGKASEMKKKAFKDRKYRYKPLRFSEYNMPSFPEENPDLEYIQQLGAVIHEISKDNPDFGKLKIILGNEWIKELGEFLSNNGREETIKLYQEEINNELSQKAANFIGFLKSGQSYQEEYSQIPEETQYGPVDTEKIQSESSGTPDISELTSSGISSGSAMKALHLISKTSFSGLMEGINWIGVSKDSGHFGVYEEALQGKGFRLNPQKIYQEKENLIQKMKEEVDKFMSGYPQNLENAAETNKDLNQFNLNYGGQNWTFGPEDIEAYMVRNEEEVEVLVVAEVMVHEAVHAHGDTGEEGPVSTEKAFLNEAINLLNQQREFEGIPPLLVGIKGEEETVDFADWVNQTAYTNSWYKTAKDKIPGGLADNKKDSDFPKDQLEKGIKVELEHTNDRQLAKEIARDHLTEDEKYYDKLKKMEEGLCNKEASNNWYRSAQIKKKLDINIPETLLKVIKELYSNGFQSLIVGGAVRDSLLGAKSKDIDIEVYGANYENIVSVLEKYGKVNIVGQAFGVIKFTDFEGEDYDFSVPRRDNKIGAGHKGFEIEFDPSITPKEAASRRDFSMNSLAYNPLTEEIYDFFGGVKDLENGILRATSPAFAEDPLRVLRGMQFAARFGMEIEPSTADMAATLKNEPLVIERITEEWMKLFTKGKYPSKVIQYLIDTEWIDNYPELKAIVGVEQEPEWHPEGAKVRRIIKKEIN